MAHYIITGSYSSAAMKGMLSHPSDREAATRSLIEACGGTLVSFFLTTGDNDFSMTVQTDDVVALMSGLIVAGASGATSNLKTVQAFTSAEFSAAQKKAGAIAAKYAAPN